MSNAIWVVMARQGIESARGLGVDERVRQQVLGIEPVTVEGLGIVADRLGVNPSDIVAEAQDDIDRHADCDHGGDHETVEPVDENDADREGEDLSGPYVIHHRPRVSLADLAHELGIKQTVKPWQPLPPADVIKVFDDTIPIGADDVSTDHADVIRDAWIGGDQS